MLLVLQRALSMAVDVPQIEPPVCGRVAVCKPFPVFAFDTSSLKCPMTLQKNSVSVSGI